MPASYLELVGNIAGQIEEASRLDLSKLPVGHFNKIVVSGMGGSSIAGAILQSYMHDSKIPVFVSRGYELPEVTDRNTLVFVVSYSGDTEETLHALKYAFRKGATTVAITSGGKLLKKFTEQQLPYVKIPDDMQPRAALAYLLIPMLNVLAKLKLLSGVSKDISETIAALKQTSYEEKAKTLAGKIVGKVPLIYASERFASVAYRWKTQFNENAKIHAFSDTFSELNHNSLMGFNNLNANYYVIILEDEDDHPRIRTRMRVTREIIAKKDVHTTQILIKGENLLTRLISAIHIGDLTSIQLAFLTNTDPEPVDVIENLKQKLGKIPTL